MGYTFEIFEEKANKKHNNKYIYHQDYLNSRTPVRITCPKHGDFFQIPSEHLRGKGCPKCSEEKNNIKYNKDNFFEEATKKFNGKYDYSKAEYKNAMTKICIICPIHGEFWQTPLLHMKGKGCPKCSGHGKYSTEEIIERFRKIHGDRYSYDKFVFKTMKSKSIITCPKHGDFLQSASKHLIGRGCPECGKESMVQKNSLTSDIVLKRMKDIANENDDLSKVVYEKMDEKVEVICKKHGSYFIRPYDYLSGHRCPKCGLLVSHYEDELYDYICSLVGKENVVKNDRSILNGYEIDILLKSMGIGFEYNGLKWHSEEFGKGCKYHLGKTEQALRKGVKLIQIFEDEYRHHTKIIKAKIRHLLGKDNNKPKIMARKCTVKEINKKDAKKFLDLNHIQGYNDKCSIALGCFHKEELIGVMTLMKTNIKDEWNLARFATSMEYVCQGVGGKLFKYFIRKYGPEKVITFADRKWTVVDGDNLYNKLGFLMEKVLKPDYKYISTQNPNNRIHKFNMRKNTLHKKYGVPLTMTESEMTKQLGYAKIWDCGLYRYVWKYKKGDTN